MNFKATKSSRCPKELSRENNVISHRYRILQEILATAPKTRERGLELKRASQKWGYSVRTLQRWLSRLEIADGDTNALGNARAAAPVCRRVYVSRTFDRAFRSLETFNPDLLVEFREKVDRLICAAWASPAQRGGWKLVRREVHTAFASYLEKLGFEFSSDSIALSQRRIRELRYFRIVDVRNHDRKTYDDQRPRITRRNDELIPMQQVVMDVKIIDCAVSRDDGTIAWPRMVAFMDTATQRLFYRCFLLRPSEGIRQEHVVAVFLEMVADPRWGFPQQLYRDNGSEFFILDLIRGALEQLKQHDIPTIINARPYSAASKPIESRFSVLDRFVFSQMDG